MQFLGVKNGAVQIFFSDTRQKHVCWKSVKSERILVVMWQLIIFNDKWVEAPKTVRCFEQNCIVKCIIFFAIFCWLLDFLLENLQLKKSSGDIHWNVWINIKLLYARNNILKKRVPNMRFLNHLYLGPNFVF